MTTTKRRGERDRAMPGDELGNLRRVVRDQREHGETLAAALGAAPNPNDFSAPQVYRDWYNGPRAKALGLPGGRT